MSVNEINTVKSAQYDKPVKMPSARKTNQQPARSHRSSITGRGGWPRTV